jgi:hypothetical protein
MLPIIVNGSLNRLRRRPFAALVVLTAISLVLAATAVAFSQGSHAPSTKRASGSSVAFPPNAAKVESLRRLARTAASETKAEVSEARIYFSTYAFAADVALDLGVVGSGPVYVIHMRGKFSTAGLQGRTARRFKERMPFTPTLTMIVDAESDRVRTIGQGVGRDLSTLGPSVRLDL